MFHSIFDKLVLRYLDQISRSNQFLTLVYCIFVNIISKKYLQSYYISKIQSKSLFNLEFI